MYMFCQLMILWRPSAGECVCVPQVRCVRWLLLCGVGVWMILRRDCTYYFLYFIDYPVKSRCLPCREVGCGGRESGWTMEGACTGCVSRGAHLLLLRTGLSGGEFAHRDGWRGGEWWGICTLNTAARRWLLRALLRMGE